MTAPALRDASRAARLARALRAWRDGPAGRGNEKGVPDGERGSAVVEFLGGTLVLLVPLVYLVITLSQLQAAAFAAEAAARDAGRLIATADPLQAQQLALRSVELAFADQGIDVESADVVTIACEQTCAPGERVLVTVRVDVALPLVPDGGVSVPITASAWTTVDPYRERQ